jgi:hypothetical protein
MSQDLEKGRPHALTMDNVKFHTTCFSTKACSTIQATDPRQENMLLAKTVR